jgi:energy-coupling factor transport system substrate-specific component
MTGPPPEQIFGRITMPTHHRVSGATPEDVAGPPATRLHGVHHLLIGLSLALGALVWATGLPRSGSLFGSPLGDLTIPAALLVAFGGISLVGAWAAHTRWRVVEIVVASVLGVAGGLFFWVVSQSWEIITGPLSFYPPASALLAGLWLLPGVLGGLVIRKPGAAIYVELVAAVLEALLGNKWGFSTVWYGLLEGLGAEMVLAVLLYRRFGLPAAVLTGAGAGVAVGLLDSFLYYPEFSAGYTSVYIALAVVSGAVIAGLGGWALARSLARAGALAPLASGRTSLRV